MQSSRRKFLTIAGGGVVLAAAAGGTFLTTRTPHRARVPWRQAGTEYSEKRKRALSYALLAPNPHNRQPWIADLGVEDSILLYVDTDRLLKETDPYDRQITIGLGCFLELLIQAAEADGFRIDLALFPEGANATALDNRPVAIARFIKDSDVVADPLFDWVLQRRSNKSPFDMSHSVSRETLHRLEMVVKPNVPGVSVGVSNDSDHVARLRKLTWNAFEVEYRTPVKMQESIDLMRMGKNEIESNPDGIDVGGGLLETLMLLGYLSPESLADPTSTGFQQGLDMYKPICETAMAHIWLTTHGNSRIEQINSGRAWVRINLAATADGLSVHPMSQALQEYEEMKPYYVESQQLLGNNGTVQMLGRLGYGENPDPSPRWSLEHKLVNG